MDCENVRPNCIVRNLANAITLFGFSLIFVLFWVIIVHREWTSIIFALATVIVITDFLDGPVARYFKSVSDFGGAIDRLRDKFFQFTMLSFFLLDQRVDLWLKFAVFPLIIIEICLLTIWFLGVRKKMNVSAGKWGKAKMALMSIGILACPISIMAQENKIQVPYFVIQILVCIFVISFWLAVMSFIKHIAKYRSQL